MSLIEKLNWRYATKRMNGAKVPQDKLNNILEAIKLAPSSAGLQPYTIIVVENADLRKKINEEACQQPQVTEGSHLLVFAAWESVTQESIDAYIQQIATERGMPIDALKDFKGMIEGVAKRPTEQLFQWCARQVYIALGFGLAAAATEGVDSTPMEGFNNEKMDEVLGLKAKGLKSIVVLALGYRDAEKDYLANAKKVRRNPANLYINLN